MEKFGNNLKKSSKITALKPFSCTVEGGRFSKIGESLCKKAFSKGGISDIGGGGVKNDSKKSDIIYGRPLFIIESKSWLIEATLKSM